MGYSIVAKSDDYQAEAGDTIAANTTAGSWTLTLPETAGDVIVFDQLRSWHLEPLFLEGGAAGILQEEIDEETGKSELLGPVQNWPMVTPGKASLSRFDVNEPWHLQFTRLLTRQDAVEEWKANAAVATDEEAVQ